MYTEYVNRVYNAMISQKLISWKIVIHYFPIKRVTLRLLWTKFTFQSRNTQKESSQFEFFRSTKKRYDHHVCT